MGQTKGGAKSRIMEQGLKGAWSDAGVGFMGRCLSKWVGLKTGRGTGRGGPCLGVAMGVS